MVQVVFACGFLKNNLQFSIDSAVIRRQLRTLHEEWVQGWQNLFARRFVVLVLFIFTCLILDECWFSCWGVGRKRQDSISVNKIQGFPLNKKYLKTGINFTEGFTHGYFHIICHICHELLGTDLLPGNNRDNHLCYLDVWLWKSFLCFRYLTIRKWNVHLWSIKHWLISSRWSLTIYKNLISQA